MVGAVAGDCGGIAGLRHLIGGEYGGAINTDLRRNGFPGILWAGTVDLGWWELREFLRHECRDASSALWRQINPEHADVKSVDTLLRRHVAQAVTDLRWLTAAQMMSDEQVGSFGFGPCNFFPYDDVESSPDGDVVEARDAAADLLALARG